MAKVIQIASEEFQDWWATNSRYNSNSNGHFVTSSRRTTKRLDKEANGLFASFGGVETKHHYWEFTYDPRNMINLAIEHGYIYGVMANYAFIPPQLEKTMSGMLNAPTGSKILYPYYGYGDLAEKHIGYAKYRYNDLTSAPTENIEFPLDGAFFRGTITKGNETIIENTSKLASGALVVGIIDLKHVFNAKFTEYVDVYYDNIETYKIQQKMWMPEESMHQISAYIIRMKRK